MSDCGSVSSSWTEDAARVLSGCPTGGPRRSQRSSTGSNCAPTSPKGSPARPLVDFRQALSGALAEASASLRHAQEILDSGPLDEAASCERSWRRGNTSPSPGSRDRVPPLPGEAWQPLARAPRGSAPKLSIPRGSTASGTPRAAVAGFASAPEPREQLSLFPVELIPRRAHHSGSTPSAASPRRKFEYAPEILVQWSRVCASLEEMHRSGMSLLHSTWVDAKVHALFVSNPAIDARRGAVVRDPDAPALALGPSFLFKKSSTVDDKKVGTLLEDHEPEDLSRVWQVVRFMCLLVLPPFTKFRMIWDLIGMTMCFHDVIMFPALVFDLSEGYLDFRSYFEWVSVVFWTVDILLNFRTGFLSSDGLLEMRRDRVARHYGRSWFVPDLAITVFDWVSLLFTMGGSGLLRVVKAASRSRRALRLLRMPKINSSFNQIVGAMNSESLSIIAGLVKFLLIIIMVTHYVACVWYWLAEAERLTWRDEYMHPDDSEMYGYCTSMHWALTQFTPASMEVVPVNVPERLYTCIVIIFAMVVFSSFVSSITQAMTLLRSHHARKVEQELLMRTFFSEFRINRGLAARCKFFLHQHQRLAKKRIKESEIPCMQLLPKAIREELRYEALMPLLKTHPFFNFYGELCPVAMRHICVSATDEVSMLPLEELFWHGQSVNRMIFVRIGMVSYLHRDYRTSPLEITAGQWACEETLWSKASLVDGPFKASIAGCELITVLPGEFQSIARTHPGPLRFCASYAELFIKEFNSASKDDDCQDLLFNSLRTIKKVVRDTCGADAVEDSWATVNRRFTAKRTKNSAMWMGNKKNRATLVRSYTTPTVIKEEEDASISIIPSPKSSKPSTVQTAKTKEFLTSNMTKDFMPAESTGSNSPGVRRTIHIG